MSSPLKMTHTDKNSMRKIQISKGETGKGICTTSNLVNTDLPWRLNSNITSSRKSFLNPQICNPLTFISITAHISVPELNYSLIKQWACAVFPTTRWATWTLHIQHLAIAGAQRMLSADTWKCVGMCIRRLRPVCGCVCTYEESDIFFLYNLLHPSYLF